MKETFKEGLQETTFIADDLQKEITVKETLNINSHLKANKEHYNFNDGYSPDRTLKRVASIPLLALEMWAKERTGQNNWFALPKDTQNQILKEKLNSNELQYFKTAKGNL